MEFENFDNKMNIEMNGFIEKGTQFDIDVRVPEDDRNVAFGVVKDEYGRSYFIGVKYFAGNVETFKFLTFISVIMLIIYTVLLMYWARNNSMNMKNVEKNMKDILSDKDILQKNFMPILSNDEIGNISYYYNKIQDKLLTQRDIMFKEYPI